MSAAVDRRRSWVRTHELLLGLVALVVGTALLSLAGGDFGPFFAAYISTGLVVFGLFELSRRILRRRPLWVALGVLAAGAVTAVFVNAATVLGPGLYIGFLVGQGFTVGLVLWLRHVTAER